MKYLSFIFLFVYLGIFSQENRLDKIDLNHFNEELLIDKVLKETNIHRERHKKRSLHHHPLLSESAKIHSSQMKKYNFFDHINRKNRKLRSPKERVLSTGYHDYSLIAENIFLGYVYLDNLPTYSELANTIHIAFKESKSHNRNLLNKNLEEFGGAIVFKETTKDGVLYYYFTQSFGSR